MSDNLIDFENINITTQVCVTDEVRDKQMAYAIANVSGRIQPGSPKGLEKIAVVCFGPSLKTEIEKIKEYKYIITCSGAHKYLIDRGIIPTWHVDVDPRPHKADMLGDPHPDVEYLMCSAVHPTYIDKLKNYNVKLWHGYTGAEIDNLPISFPRGDWVFSGGATCGLRTMILARFLGFTQIDIFGMDCSYPDDNEGEHADKHPNPCKDNNKVTVEYQGIRYKTSYAMIEYTRQFFNELTLLPDINLSLHGIGFLQHLAFTGWRPNNVATMRSEAILAFNAPEIISKHYLEQNKILHQYNPNYGISGSRYKDHVLSLSQRYDSTDILDYGCGKGTLSKSLPFPINEYDPAIEGKDSAPKPADIVVCTDVLEHIEPDYLDNVLNDIVRCTRKVAYLVIATGPASKNLPDGRNTHLIQQKKPWWWKKLDPLFEIVDMYEEGPHIYVEAKIKHKSLGTLEAVDKETLSFSYAEVEGIKFVTVNKNTKWRASTLLTKEPNTIAWLNTIEKDDVLVDIGANVGVYSLYAAKKRGAYVYAFEPESQNYAILSQNIFINEIKNVKAYCLSIVDKLELGVLNLTEFNPGSSCHQFNTTLNYNGVQSNFVFEQGSLAVSLDFLVEQGLVKQPTHIKIDVDGLEPKVVLGSLKTIQKAKSLCIEVNINLEEHKKMIELLKLFGFTYDQLETEKYIRKDGPFKNVGEYVFRRNEIHSR